VLEARGSVRHRGVRILATHRFRRASIESRWRVACRRRCKSMTVRAFFPTWGSRASIDAVLRDGTQIRLAGARAEPGRRLRLGEIVTLTLGRGHAGGYRLVPLSGTADATLSALPAPRHQPAPRSEPRDQTQRRWRAALPDARGPHPANRLTDAFVTAPAVLVTKPTAGLEPATPSLRASAGPETWEPSRAWTGTKYLLSGNL
jgi:hypothetical protein